MFYQSYKFIYHKASTVRVQYVYSSVTLGAGFGFGDKNNANGTRNRVE